MVSRRTARAMADQNNLTNEEMQAVQVQLGMVKLNAWMIDPREVKRLWMWDATTASSLIFVAMITPIEVGFLEPSTSWWDPLFLINQLINVIFVLDLVLQFRTSWPLNSVCLIVFVSSSYLRVSEEGYSNDGASRVGEQKELGAIRKRTRKHEFSLHVCARDEATSILI